MSGNIIFTKNNHIGTIVINRPNKLNAVTKEMAEEINQLAHEINNDQDVRVVVLHGGGENNFCAGSDVALLDQYGTNWELRNRIDYAYAVKNIRKPVIAMLRGYTLGGGLELAMCCDVRIASETAKLGTPESKLGWIGGAGNTQILPRLVGYGKAAEMNFTGEYLDAEEARFYRLVEKVVPDQLLEGTVYEMAGKIAKRSPIVMEIAKHALRTALNTPLEIGMSIENNLFAYCFTTEDSVEGRKAFVEKREPCFRGR